MGIFVKTLKYAIWFSKVHLLPRRWLTPIENFKRDGWNRVLFDSVPDSPPVAIVVFGGFLGDSVQAWLKRVPDSKVIVFEPVNVFAKQIKKRFAGENVETHAFGIGAKNEKRIFKILGESTYSSSLDRFINESKSVDSREVEFLPILEVAPMFPEEIGVMEINIEGGEYELIDLLVQNNIIANTEFLFVQFHDIGQDTISSISSSRALLSQTHEMVWSYELIWELWKKSGRHSAS